jgi:hypothetical protein
VSVADLTCVVVTDVTETSQLRPAETAAAVHDNDWYFRQNAARNDDECDHFVKFMDRIR